MTHEQRTAKWNEGGVRRPHVSAAVSDVPNVFYVGFTDAELTALHKSFRDGARGSVMIAVRQNARILTFALPPTRSEEGAVRQMRDVAKRLKAIRSDGWLLARRAMVPRPSLSSSRRILGEGATTSEVPVLLVQESVRFQTGLKERCIISPLYTEAAVLYECREVQKKDRVAEVLEDICNMTPQLLTLDSCSLRSTTRCAILQPLSEYPARHL